MSLHFDVLFSVPDSKLSIRPTSRQHPRNVFIHLNTKKISLFHVSAFDTKWLWLAILYVRDIPYLTLLVDTNSAQHVIDVRTECCTRACFFVGLHRKQGLLKLSCVKPIHYTAFCGNNKIVFVCWVPVTALYVLAYAFVELMQKARILTANVYHVQFAIIASRQEHLFIYCVPFDKLYLISVEFLVCGFTFNLIKVPNSHCVVSRT